MTDAEMERLDRMAQEGVRRLRKTMEHPGASNREKRRAEAELASPYSPAAVLALIERVRQAEDALDTMRVDLEDARGAAEKNSAAYFAADERARKAEEALKCDHGRETVYCVEAFNEAVDRAERKGAEEMREKAAQEGEEWSGRCAFRIRAIPLPGDAP